MRNPLSIAVSAYHSHLSTHDDAGWLELAALFMAMPGKYISPHEP